LPDRDWEAWLGARVDDHLDRTRAAVAELKQGGRDAAATLGLWNDVNVWLQNAFAVAELLSNVHPDEAVRSRGEKAEQDAQKLLTEIGLDRELFDVLEAVDPTDLDDEARRVLTLSLRDFRRAGVDQSEEVRERVRALS
jgi:thimet oligopeptidase